MQSHFTPLDLFVLVAYFLATLAVGLSFWKTSRTVAGSRSSAPT